MHTPEWFQGTEMTPVRSKKVPEGKHVARLQCGALTYRRTKTSAIEILLMTSRDTKRWIIPKGWPIKGMQPCDSAAQEAYEEAGVRGTIGPRPIGTYIYNKRLKSPTTVVPCEVQVYALQVHSQENTWPEIGQRELRWCQADEAITIVDDRDLGILIQKFLAQEARCNSDRTPTQPD